MKSCAGDASAPIVSVIVAAYNAEQWIGAQLEALARQRWDKPWEVIVSDNGSTDSTLSVVAEYRDRLPIHVVDSSDMRGPSHARNVAARAARAGCLAFCDADDEVADGWLAAVGSALEHHQLVVCRYDGHKLNPAWLQSTRSLGYSLHNLPFPPFHAIGGAGGMAVHAALHEQLGGFDESLPVLQDNDYCIRAQLQGVELHYLADAVVHYRFRRTVVQIFRQGRAYSRARAGLQKRYASRDWHSSAWRWPLRGWRPILKSLPGIASRSGRARLAWMCGWQLGRFEGSIRYRVLAL